MKIPNLEGESLRDAMEVLTLMKVKVNVQGEGYVVSQLEAKENGQRIVQLTLKSAQELITGSAVPMKLPPLARKCERGRNRWKRVGWNCR